jgi:hypothetical protein
MRERECTRARARGETRERGKRGVEREREREMGTLPSSRVFFSYRERKKGGKREGDAHCSGALTNERESERERERARE